MEPIRGGGSDGAWTNELIDPSTQRERTASPRGRKLPVEGARDLQTPRTARVVAAGWPPLCAPEASASPSVSALTRGARTEVATMRNQPMRTTSEIRTLGMGLCAQTPWNRP